MRNDAAMRHLILISLLAAITPSAWAQIPLETEEVVLPAQLEHDGRTVTLLPRKPVAEGDTIRTGDRASVNLRFARDGVITLGNASQLFIHSAAPASPGRGALLRLQLLRGELTLDAYPASHTFAQDYRLNLGPLRVRALGADLWAYASDAGEAICLRQGALEITGEAGEQRLDLPGQCLQHSAGGEPKLVQATETDLKAHLLGTGQNAGTEPEPVIAVPLTATEKSAPEGGKHWTVVVASLPDQSSAKGLARTLRQHGLTTEIRAAGASPSTFRVTYGEYPDRKAASQVAQQLRRDQQIKDAWVAVLP
jgi:hypothetical protein